MKRSILVLFWVFMSATMFAQGGIDVAGIVLDEQGQELIGVSVQIKGKQGVGVVTDFDGRFISCRRRTWAQTPFPPVPQTP